MRLTSEIMKNTFDVLLLVSTKKCPIRMLLLIMSNGNQIGTIGWLQSYEQEEEDIQVDKKLQIGTSAYLVFKSCDDAMGRQLTMNSTSK